MEHKSFIDLETSGFEMTPEVMRTFPDIWVFKKKEMVTVKDFGTVFVGWDKLQTDTQRERVLDLSASEGPIFTIPEDWRFPHLLRALGAFKSASQASKNGWNKDIEPGCTEILIRLHKVRGSVWIHRISDIDLEVS